MVSPRSRRRNLSKQVAGKLWFPNFVYAGQSSGICVVVIVGQRPPANVIFRLWPPDVVSSLESSIFADGSFILASGRMRLDQAFNSASSSKSKRTLSAAFKPGLVVNARMTQPRTRTRISIAPQRPEGLEHHGNQH